MHMAKRFKTRVPRPLNGKRTNFSTNGIKKTVYIHAKNMKLVSYLKPYINIFKNWRELMNLNIFKVKRMFFFSLFLCFTESFCTLFLNKNDLVKLNQSGSICDIHNVSQNGKSTTESLSSKIIESNSWAYKLRYWDPGGFRDSKR